MNFALIIDLIGNINSYYVKNNKPYNLKGELNEFNVSIGSECYISTWNYPWLYENGHFINWSEFKYDLPDLDLDLIFLTVERCLNRKDEFPWIEVENIRKKYPNAKIVGFIKEVWVGTPYDYNHPKHLARIDFLNRCDAVVMNRPELKEFKNLSDNVDVPFNFVAQPHNIDYYYDNFWRDKDRAIWVYDAHRPDRIANTVKFSSYISEKYNIPLKYKKVTSEKDWLIPLKDFITQWSSCAFHFNLDPIDYFPGNQVTQTASTGTLNIGGVNDNHFILYPETATCDLKILEEKFVEYLDDENKFFKDIKYAWNKVNEIFSFNSVRKQIREINYYD